MKKIIGSFIIYSILLVAIFYSYKFYQSNQKNVTFDPMVDERIEQPPILNAAPWSVKSVDTQVISKHWSKVSQSSIQKQISMLKELGFNYIAIATPYDNPDDMMMWATEIHAQGMNVWFRSHWNSWEGDNGKTATMTATEYVEKTHKFIIDNRYLFQPGDAFTLAVEPEQAGIGLGKKFKDWDVYKKFFVNQIGVSSDAFSKIGLKGQIHTNWLSTNAWIAENILTENEVQKVGLITIDHFPDQTKIIGDKDDTYSLATAMSDDLDRIHKKWNVPILLGEWGYQIYQEIDESTQAEAIGLVFETLKTKPYLIGINYWVHMGHNSKLINDTYGENLKYRSAAFIIQQIYRPELTPTPTPKLTKLKK